MPTNQSTHVVLDKIDGIKREINEMADTLQKENRERNEQEEARWSELRRELSYWEMKLAAAGAEREKRTSPWTSFREKVQNQERFAVQLRESMTTADLDGNPIVPLTVGELIQPLEEGTIIGKLGMKMPTGLRGRYESTVIESVDVTLEDEDTEAPEKKIKLDSVAADYQRLAGQVLVTREALFQSDGKLEAIIKEQLVKGLSRALNQIMLGTEPATATARIKGPFVDLKDSAPALAAFGVSTFKELNKMKASILRKGFTSERMCWVMSEGTKAELEATPKDKGSGIMVIENGMLCGLPVYCSHFIGEDYIGLGDWSYQLCGLFDQVSMLVDPYTYAGKNKVRFVLNANYGTLTYRPEAFALAKVTRD